MSLAHRLQTGGSVQALVVLRDEHLVAGLQGGSIAVWSLKNYQRLLSLPAHEQGVLGLSVSSDGQLLFSSGVDSVLKVWSTSDFQCQYAIHSPYEIGDLFCVVYSTRLRTVFCGAQNQSIQWHHLGSTVVQDSLSPTSFAASRRHRFFDSSASEELEAVTLADHDSSLNRGQIICFNKANYQAFAHSSYIYCMLLIPGLLTHEPEEEILVTGAGDGDIKLWSISVQGSEGLTQRHEFENEGLNVLSMTSSGTFLYAGLSNGNARVYNLETRQLIQKLDVRCGDVGVIQVIDDKLLCGTSSGSIKQFNSQLTEIISWRYHAGKILGSAIAHSKGKELFITGANDNMIAFWDVTEAQRARRDSLKNDDDLVHRLQDFVAYKSISTKALYAGDCNQAAIFLRKLFTLFDADATFLRTDDGINPIVLARLAASTTSSSKKSTILFYGHYDVVDAEYNANDWHADPFQLHPLNGYLYGRGVTDNKGPILAALYAAAELAKDGKLSCNVVFLIEGEEEAGSRGFANAVRESRDIVGNVDYILLANSYWLDDHIPCLTYGMRGVIRASLAVTSGKPDRHSGMDGKASTHEPLKDLVQILSFLSRPEIPIPGFYDPIRELGQVEKTRYSAITSALMPGHPEIRDATAFTTSLIQRWREPNLTVHSVEVSDTKNTVTIPGSAKATLSIRIVPGQDAADTAEALVRYSKTEFAKLKSTNKLEARISSTADAWLGVPTNKIFQALENAITDVWTPSPGPGSENTVSPIPMSPTISPVHRSPPHRRASTLANRGNFTFENMPRKPLYIREGGSIPAISFLERELNAPAAMFPMGQASDNAHLGNERMRVENLYKGREVFKKVFSQL